MRNAVGTPILKCDGGTAARLRGNRRKVTGEPPARRTLTDLSSGLLEPQGKPGWGKTSVYVYQNWPSKSSASDPPPANKSLHLLILLLYFEQRNRCRIRESRGVWDHSPLKNEGTTAAIHGSQVNLTFVSGRRVFFAISPEMIIGFS